MWGWGVRVSACSETRAAFSAAYLLHHTSRLLAYLEQEKTTISCSTCMHATHGTPATRTGKKHGGSKIHQFSFMHHPRAARVVVFAGPALCASTVVLPAGLCPGSRGLILRSDIRAAGFVGAGLAFACPTRRRSPMTLCI
jgi:hypothetical protein